MQSAYCAWGKESRDSSRSLRLAAFPTSMGTSSLLLVFASWAQASVDAEFFQPVAQGAEGHAQPFGGCGAVPAGFF